MAEPMRPDSVGDDAICIPPSITQAATVASIEVTNAHDNYDSLRTWVRGLRDWAYNARRCHEAGQDIPPRPVKPDVYRTEVTYATQAGQVQTGPRADDGQYYAWVETIVT